MAVFSSSRARRGATNDLRLHILYLPVSLSPPQGDSAVYASGCSALTLIVLQDVGCKATLVAHIGGILPIFGLDDPLEVMVDLSTNAHGFLERAGSHWQNHELLHGQLVSSMRAPVDHIEGLGHRSWCSELGGIGVKGEREVEVEGALCSQLSGLGCIMVLLRAFPSFYKMVKRLTSLLF